MIISELSAADVAGVVGGRLARGDTGLHFGRVCTDTRTLVPGSLFVAIRGERFDGHQFLAQALAAGAAGLMIDAGRPGVDLGGGVALIEVEDTLRALGDLARALRQRHPVPLIAVTGSNGKTTTKELLYSILTEGGRRVLKNEGNFNNLIGVPLTLFRLERGHQAAVVEMGMNRPGEIARLTGICEPDVGLITSVAAAHTAGLGDIAGVARAKGEIFARLPASARAVVNLDDEWVRGLETKAQRITFSGQREDADVFGVFVRDLGLRGLEFRLTVAGRTVEKARLGLVGRHKLSMALAAAAAAHAAGVGLERIAAGLEAHVPAGAKRLEAVRGGGGFWCLNDAYNANPASMAAGLKTAAEVARNQQGRLFAALGEMLELGALSEEAHKETGRLCFRLGARAVAFLAEGSGPLYGAGAVDAGMDPSAVLAGETCAEIASRLRPLLAPNDVLLVKGSRRTRMERVVEALIEPETHSEDAGNRCSTLS
ncbi:MAG: UDP-N-acetylmuramoyl-tripeptide--D-alanyl-D-alanine ligase [Pseudomonadota bacterium]